MTLPSTVPARILATLRTKPDGLNRIEAQKLGDPDLPATIFKLRTAGHVIVSEWQRIERRVGRPLRVARYRLAGSAP